MALHTIQELLFYYEAAKDSDEKVLKSSLLSPQIGYASYIAKGSILIMKEAIKMLEKDKNWSTIHGLCYRLLDGACANDDGIVKDPKGADWAVWTSYIDSILHLKQKE